MSILQMQKIIQENLTVERKVLSKEEAKQLFSSRGENFKIELIDEILDDQVSLYQQGEFIDLCRGPHIPSTGSIKAYKLLSVSGAYWRGKETNPMLQRIYGIAFDDKDKLKNYL